MNKPYRVVSASVDLEAKRATVVFGTGKLSRNVTVHVSRFDPAGEQTESELRHLAVERAKQTLQAIIAADPQ